MTAAPADWRIVEYKGFEGLRVLEADWKRLVAEMPDAGPQHTFETHAAYFQHLSKAGDRFICFALMQGNAVRAICPLEPGTVSILGTRDGAWGLPWGQYDLKRDVICPPGEAEHYLVPLLVQHLNRYPWRARWLVFDQVLDDSVLIRCLRHVDKRLYQADPCGHSARFDCEKPFEELAARFSKHFRANLRYARSKVAGLGGVRFEHVREPGRTAEAVEQFLILESSGWKGASGDGGALLTKGAPLAFFRALLESHAAAGQCEINLLHADGRCIAAQCCIRAGSQYAIPKLAYDEAYAQAAPGQLLLEDTLRRCCDDPAVARLHMISDERWFTPWRVHRVPVHTIYVGLGRTIRAVRMALLRWRLTKARTAKHWLHGVWSS